MRHEIRATGEVEVVGVFVTGTFPKPPPADHIELPWSPDGRARTHLRKPSYAVCSHSYIYPLKFASEDEIEFGGFVDGPLFERIKAKVKELSPPQSGEAG